MIKLQKKQKEIIINLYEEYKGNRDLGIDFRRPSIRDMFQVGTYQISQHGVPINKVRLYTSGRYSAFCDFIHDKFPNETTIRTKFLFNSNMFLIKTSEEIYELKIENKNKEELNDDELLEMLIKKGIDVENVKISEVAKDLGYIWSFKTETWRSNLGPGKYTDPGIPIGNKKSWENTMLDSIRGHLEAVETFNKRKVKILAADPVPPIPPVPSQSFQYIYHPEEFKIE